jgi:hypothetical protein
MISLEGKKERENHQSKCGSMQAPEETSKKTN